jgi:hypothetical protein
MSFVDAPEGNEEVLVMVPAVSDPKWNKFVANLRAGEIRATELPTKMFVNRLKIKVMFDQSEAVKRIVIGEAHDYFTKNQDALKADIHLIFG